MCPPYFFSGFSESCEGFCVSEVERTVGPHANSVFFSSRTSAVFANAQTKMNKFDCSFNQFVLPVDQTFNALHNQQDNVINFAYKFT